MDLFVCCDGDKGFWAQVLVWCMFMKLFSLMLGGVFEVYLLASVGEVDRIGLNPHFYK